MYVYFHRGHNTREVALPGLLCITSFFTHHCLYNTLLQEFLSLQVRKWRRGESGMKKKQLAKREFRLRYKCHSSALQFSFRKKDDPEVS